MGIEETEYGEIDIMYYGKRHSMEFDCGITTTDFVEEVVAPMMISLGYFPTNVYESLGMTETLEVIKEAVNNDR